MNALLGAALAYAARGWPVFPCKAGAKAPATAHGFLDATTDLAAIREWWTRHPDDNVAIATGTPGPDVLDIDVKPAGSGFPALRRLQRSGVLAGAFTLVRTQGGGAHLYFAGTGQDCHSSQKHHVDFRACGGYVLAPPSQVNGRPYELAEARAETGATLSWATVLEVLDPPRPAPRPRVIRRHDGGGLPPGVQRALDGPAGVGYRSAALHRLVAACVRAGLDDTTIHGIAAGYEPAAAKYGQRLAAEVDRCLAKLGDTA